MKSKKIIFVLCLIFPIILLFTCAKASLEGKVDLSKPLLRVVVLDVWQGDSIFIEFPNGKIALIDAGQGGMTYYRFDAGKMVVAPFLRRNHIKTIDYLVMTHPHADHIGGFPYILENFNVKNVYDCGMPYTTELYMRCLEIISKKHIHYEVPLGIKKLHWCPGVRIYQLHPTRDWEYSDNPNDNSIVLLIKYKKVSFLLTGDAEEASEASIVDSGFNIHATILKVPHHGSDTSSTDEFIDAVDPEVAIISVGKGNKFHHPAPTTILKYKSRGIKLYRTDYDGNVEILTDGYKYQIKTYKRKRRKKRRRG